jgi:hypothetical protein
VLEPGGLPGGLPETLREQIAAQGYESIFVNDQGEVFRAST